MIELKSVSKVFQTKDIETRALDDICLKINSSEFVSIMGPSGCGKSTLLNLIGLLDQPTAGTILIHDTDVSRMSDREAARFRNKSLGFVFQNFHLVPSLNVMDNVELPLLYGRVAAVERKERVKEVLNMVGLSHRMKHFPSQLSGGQCQRVAIARAIAKKAKVLVFDDSFSALDMKTDAALRKELNEKVQDASIVIVAQRVSTILHADQILVLDDGKIVGKGTHEELLKNCEVYLQIAKSQLSEKELGLEKLGLAEEKAEKETNKKEILSTKIDEKENNKLKEKSDDKKLKHKKGGK